MAGHACVHCKAKVCCILAQPVDIISADLYRQAFYQDPEQAENWCIPKAICLDVAGTLMLCALQIEQDEYLETFSVLEAPLQDGLPGLVH